MWPGIARARHERTAAASEIQTENVCIGRYDEMAVDNCDPEEHSVPRDRRPDQSAMTTCGIQMSSQA
jgi:hypothetical protein